MKRRITEKAIGFRTQDGAGISLVWVLGKSTMETFDALNDGIFLKEQVVY